MTRAITQWLTSAGGSGALGGIARVFLMKGAFIALSFAVITLAARAFSPDEFGVYSIWFSAVGIAGTLAMLGQQVLLMRSWSEYSAAQDMARLKGALLYSLVAVVAGIAVFGGLVFAQAWFATSAWAAVAVFAYLAAFAVVNTTAHLVRAAVGVGRGDGVGNILMSGVPVIYLGACLLFDLSADLGTVFLAFAGGAFAAVLVHVVTMVRLVRDRAAEFRSATARIETRQWSARSLKLALSHSLEAANQYLDVLVIGFLVSPAAAGAYFVLTRLANAFATAADATNMFSTRHIPRLHFAGDHANLARLLDSVAGTTIAVTVFGFLGFVVLGAPILSVFNPDYAALYPALLVLCLGTAMQGAALPSASILMLTGHEGRYLVTLAVAVAARIAAFVVLVPMLGIMGAAIATSLSFVIMSVLIVYSARTLAGIDGSVLRLLPRRRQPLAPGASE